MWEIIIIIGLVIAIPYGIGNVYIATRNNDKFNMVVTWLLENDMTVASKTMLLGLLLVLAIVIGVATAFAFSPLIVVEIIASPLIKKLGGKKK